MQPVKLSKRSATDVDRILGETIRRVRLINGMSRATLCAQVGVTVQQLRKYEIGSNRIAVSMLFDIASALGVSAVDLIEGTSSATASFRPLPPMSDKSLELALLYERVPTHKARQAILILARRLNGEGRTVSKS